VGWDGIQIVIIPKIIIEVFVKSINSCKAGASEQCSRQPYFNNKMLLF
jgi:hypothetical protein